MHIKIEPHHDADLHAFQVTVNGWGTGANYHTYDGACRVASAIAAEAVNPKGITTIDYSACLTAKEAS